MTFKPPSTSPTRHSSATLTPSKKVMFVRFPLIVRIGATENWGLSKGTRKNVRPWCLATSVFVRVRVNTQRASSARLVNIFCPVMTQSVPFAPCGRGRRSHIGTRLRLGVPEAGYGVPGKERPKDPFLLQLGAEMAQDKRHHHGVGNAIVGSACELELAERGWQVAPARDLGHRARREEPRRASPLMRSPGGAASRDRCPLRVDLSLHLCGEVRCEHLTHLLPEGEGCGVVCKVHAQSYPARQGTPGASCSVSAQGVSPRPRSFMALPHAPACESHRRRGVRTETLPPVASVAMFRPDGGSQSRTSRCPRPPRRPSRSRRDL